MDYDYTKYFSQNDFRERFQWNPNKPPLLQWLGMFVYEIAAKNNDHLRGLENSFECRRNV